MATIYGTPVILLKKPDTSEQWIINVSPDVGSLIPGADSVVFNVPFTSNSKEYSKIQFIPG